MESKSFAIDRPIPFDEPVMSATLFLLNFRCIILNYHSIVINHIYMVKI